MSPIEYHSGRATAERLIATNGNDLGPAAVHVALAEMHEQLVMVGINDHLAPRDQFAQKK